MKNILLGTAIAGLITSCGGAGDEANAQDSVATLYNGDATVELEGSVELDGSSTVYPISEAIAEEYRSHQSRVQVKIGISGTGGGFKKFIAGETHISNASRFIKQKEIDHALEVGREYIELPVAYDGLAVVVHPDNDWATSMTVEELHQMWNKDATATKWSDIRAGWPDREFELFAPGQDSGTFDYFTETINGASGDCRPDASFSEDDNVLVKGVSGTLDGIGFFGLAYYEENADKLGVVAVDGGSGNPVLPNMATVESGEYAPLSRPLFIYVTTDAAADPVVDDFVRFYLDNAGAMAAETGYVPLPSRIYDAIRERYTKRTTGTLAGQHGTLEDLYL